MTLVRANALAGSARARDFLECTIRITKPIREPRYGAETCLFHLMCITTSETCLSPGKARSHLIEELLQAHFRHLHHLTHRPVVFCHGHFRLAVPQVFEGDRMTLVCGKSGGIPIETGSTFLPSLSDKLWMYSIRCIGTIFSYCQVL